jgi:hypothetical protein
MSNEEFQTLVLAKFDKLDRFSFIWLLSFKSN